MQTHSASRLLLILLGLALPLCVFGGVYKWVGPDGKVTYSDKPQPGAIEVEMPKFPAVAPVTAPVTTSTTAPAASGPQADAKKSVPPFKGYSKLSIVKPESDATVRENTGNVQVELASEPEWNPQWGHKVSLTLDGKPLPETHAATKFDLHNVDRGSHTLQITVLDEKGVMLITSQSVTFHMKRQSAKF